MNNNISYPNTDNWKNWKKDYQFGTLVFIPKGDLFSSVDKLRQQYDPSSAETSMPHMTLTQPFSKAPSKEEINEIEKVINDLLTFSISTNKAISSPGDALLWVDVYPKKPFIKLRNTLHEIGIFRTDLPYTDGFIPHMTISEFGKMDRSASEVINNINSSNNLSSDEYLEVCWIVPNDDFVFQIGHTFPRGVR